MESLRRQLLWYIILRLVVTFSIALVYGLVYVAAGAAALPEPPLRFLLRLAGFTGAASLVHLILFRTLDGRLPLQAYLQYLTDLVLITYLVFQFGSNNSFSPLYLVVIIVASAMLGQRAGLGVASVAYLLYAFFQVSFAFQLFPWLPGADVAEGWSLRLIYSLLIHLVGFLATALLSAQLRQRARQAEDALEIQREDLADLKVVHQDVVESIPSGICTTDLTGRITTLNRTGREILRVDPHSEEILGQSIHESFLSHDKWTEMTLAATRAEVRFRSEATLEIEGEPVFIGFSISRLMDGDGEQQGYIVIFQDLTQWRRLEQEVRLKDRMAAVGEMAAGLAHEIGNPLAAISGSVQMLTHSASATDAEKKLLEILVRESQRLDRTIKGFLRFARPRDKATVRFDIGTLLEENVELLRNSPELSDGHRVTLRLEPRTVHILGDPDQITQIFWNLARNALKAMPEGGLLELTGKLAGGWYRLSFRDSGRGMSEEEKANLFHPFQSFFDSGIGIGMAIVYRIVEEHEGELSVDSAPGKGTTITVALPATSTSDEGVQ